MDLELLKLLFKWIFDRKSRLILMGYRPEVICIVMGAQANDSYLIIRSQSAPSYWAPLQEGIERYESIEDAAKRCLSVEMGIEEASIQYRRGVWVGKLKLLESRWDERDLAHSLRGILGGPKMVGKGYFASFIIADSDVKIKNNPAEVIEWEWVTSTEFTKRIEANPQGKACILGRAWKLLVKHSHD